MGLLLVSGFGYEDEDFFRSVRANREEVLWFSLHSCLVQSPEKLQLSFCVGAHNLHDEDNIWQNMGYDNLLLS